MNTSNINEGSKYPWHPIANIFPMMAEGDLEELVESVQRSGQREGEDIVLLDGQILDGRNRERAILRAGKTPRYRNYDPAIDGPEPTRFVLDHNLARRHLTPGQRAACATEALTFLEADALKRREANLKQNQPSANGDPAVALAADVTGTNGTEDGKVFPPEEQGESGPSAEKVAEEFGTSPRSVKRAKRVKNVAPEKFEEVKKGETSLNAAEKEVKKKEAAEDLDDPEFQEKRTELAPAFRKSHGEDFTAAFLAGTILKTKADTQYFAEATADEQALLVPYIVTGWEPKRAMKFIMRSLEPKDPIEHLITRAANTGKGKYETSVGGWKIKMTLEK